MKKTLTIIAALGFSLCAVTAFASRDTHKISVTFNNHTHDLLYLRNRFVGHWHMLHPQLPFYFVASKIRPGKSWHDEMVRPASGGSEFDNPEVSNHKFSDFRDPTSKSASFMADNGISVHTPVLSERITQGYTAHFTNVVRGHHEYVTVDVFP
jgi:hypothetical protein